MTGFIGETEGSFTWESWELFGYFNVVTCACTDILKNQA